jgi:hypothetical protein
MVTAEFEHDGDVGILTVVTHFGTTHKIDCKKQPTETFRLGGTAVNEVIAYEGVVTDVVNASFKAFITSEKTFAGNGVLSPEGWKNSPELHCYVTEYYPLDMEGKRPGWLVSRMPIKDANRIFINLDAIDGGGNVIKRYRVSPFFGDYIVLENV